MQWLAMDNLSQTNTLGETGEKGFEIGNWLSLARDKKID